jgi:DNA-binding transcriptional regulator YiaG
MMRTDISPVWTRSYPISKQPQTMGEHLRKRRFDSGIRQSEAARILHVSTRTLSLWETDRIYPTWPFQPRITQYLGLDPFTDPALGRPKGNEPPGGTGVAFLTTAPEPTWGQRILGFRWNARKNRKQFATELGVSIKTLRDWEINRRKPTRTLLKRVEEFLATSATHIPPTTGT